MEAFNQDVERILTKAEKDTPLAEHTAEKQKEVIHSVVTDEVEQETDGQESESAVPSDTQNSVGLEYESVPAYTALPEDGKKTVKGYVDRVHSEGIVKVARQAKKGLSGDPAALDAVFDTIAFIIQQEAQEKRGYGD